MDPRRTDLLGFYGPDCPTQPPNPWRMSALFAHVDPVAQTWDTVVVMPGTERNSPMYRVFGHEALSAIAPDGTLWVHDTDSEEIVNLDLDGDTLAVLRRPFDPRPVPAEARTLTGPEPLESSSGRTMQMPDYMYPDELPALARLAVGKDGRVWAMAYPEVTEPSFTVQFIGSTIGRGPVGGASWRVLDDDGRILGELRTPPRFYPTEIGADYMLGVATDEFDVETVVMYPIERPAA